MPQIAEKLKDPIQAAAVAEAPTLEVPTPPTEDETTIPQQIEEAC